MRDAELTDAIMRMYEENYHVYGARKIWKEMGRAGHEVARCAVERLMKAEGLKGGAAGEVAAHHAPEGRDRTAR